MQNFGKIKNAFYDILTESIIKKDANKKAIFTQYLKAIRENKILKTEFLVYTNLEDKSEINEFKANNFVKSNIDFLRGFSKDEIEKANESLIEKLGKYKKKIEKPYDSKITKLHENITKLLFTKNNPKTINTINETIDNIVEYIQENKPKEIIKENLVSTNALTSVVLRKFNEKYADLTEDERNLLKALIAPNDQVKEEEHKKIVTECITLIDSKLNENDFETKDKLLKVKDKLLQNTYNSKTYANDINKLIVLKTDLIKN